MTGWTEYTLALALFVASHFLPRLGDLRGRLIARIGRRAYFAGYGLLSLALLVWVIAAAGRAPFVELWPQTGWTRWVPNLAMPVALILAAAGPGLRQPFTLGGKRGVPLDPADPGLAALSRHPLFVALALWALAHMVPNGDLAHVILFGLFAALALAAIPIFDARARQSLGPDAPAFFATTAILSLRPLARPTWCRANARSLAIRTAIAIALWLTLYALHGPVIGVPPTP
ncbi:MAG: NnrU family protein [Pseudomonadota bacterium]|nr:NnrU family protein [Pseudomonadota bacterium]